MSASLSESGFSASLAFWGLSLAGKVIGPSFLASSSRRVTSNPEASIVTLMRFPISGMSAMPHLTLTVLGSEEVKTVISLSSLAAIGFSHFLAQLNFIISLFEVLMSCALSSGDFRAFSIAFVTRFSPSPSPEEMMAVPLSFRVFLTSWKSTLMKHFSEMISEIARAALARVSSAFAKQLNRSMSGYKVVRFSLFMTSSASTYFCISFAPSRAVSIFCSPSKRNGTVTMPMVSTPASLASWATTGAAPVPVPPPMPAVMKTISVSLSNSSLILSMLASAHCRPTKGSLPAPWPCVMS